MWNSNALPRLIDFKLLEKLKLKLKLKIDKSNRLSMNSLARSIIIGTSLAVPTLLGSAVVQAQGSGLALEEVIVTAQKRQQTLQDVPISVSAFSNEMLQTMGIDELEDLGAHVPNLFLNGFNNDPTTVRLFIRGIGQNDVQLTQDPSVALYIDGIYVGTSVGSGMETVELERIEVLRGPQGTLYGRNATGGAINLISQRPNPEALGFKQSFTVGNFGLLKSRTSLNVPVADNAAVKVAFLASDRDGLTKNDGQGDDWSEEDRSAWRLDFSAELTDELSLDYAYDFTKNQDSSRLEFIHDAVNPFGLATFSTGPSRGRPDRAVAFRGVEAGDVEVSGHSLTLTWDASDSLTIKSITGTREVDSFLEHDGTPTVGILGDNPASWSERDTEFEQFSQEIQILGELWNDQIEYVAGIYYYEDEATQQVDSWSVLGVRDPNDFTESENESLALFGQFTYTPESAEDWHLTVGMRFSKDKREASRINENSITFAALGGFTQSNCDDPYFQGQACPGDPLGAVVGTSYDESFENFNPSVTLAYDWTQDINVYGKVVTGYKSGGTSQRSANPNSFGEGFDEEDVISYELGLKGRFWDSRLALNVAVFHMEIDGFQASVQTGGTAGDRDFTPVDDNVIEGFEADLTVLLAQGLELRLGYGHLDSEMGVDTIETLLSTGQVQVTEVVQEIAYAPKNSYTAALDYRTSVGWGDLAFHLGYSYQDGAVTSLNEFDNIPLDDRGLFDADVTLSQVALAGGKLRVSVWGRNLADEEYLLVNTGSLRELFPGGALGLSPWSTWGDPRTYGATLEWVY
ncbi:MAG: iron complex outermembrane receptor protein [Halioglobus sp.]|jgi:iron complex outermembrane receptor protein